MAAIFGLLGPHNPEKMEDMAARLRHRGPLCHIEAFEDRCSVGAIGDDPRQMICRSGRALSVAAGRIYGVDDDLPPRESGWNLAEMLQQRFENGGIGGLAAIDGDFAAVVYQDDGKRVALLRDFFGCLPLFWARLDSACLAFASEYKAFLALDSFSPAVDRAMLQHLQATKRVPVGRTLLSNVAAAKPGITIFRNCEIAEYDKFPPLACNVSIRDEDTAKQVVHAGFRGALRRRSGNSGAIGLALSGGIDSIAMAFQLRSMFPDREIHTFTAGYGDSDPEMATAAEVADEIHAIHHPVQTSPSLVAISLRKLVWHMEDPSSRSEALQLMRIGEVASEHVSALLSGQGTDGLFAGMPRHKVIRLANRFPALKGPLFDVYDLTQMGLQPASLLGKMLALGLYRGKVPPVPRIIDGGILIRPERTPPGPHFLNRMLAAGYQNASAQDAGKFERTFGASGVGYTSPCLDVSFARTAFTIDERLKIRNDTEKYIFRTAMAAVVPKRFRSVPKHPQRMQYDIEFAECLDELAERYLSPSSVQSRGFFEGGSIVRIRQRSPGRPYAAEAAMRLWTAIATEIWARLFLDNEAVDSDS